MEGKDLKTVKALGDASSSMSLSKREKHLIGLAVTLTAGCTTCTTRRFTEALEDGISKKELTELTDLVALTNAGVVARTAMSSWSDDNDSICNDGTCSVK